MLMTATLVVAIVLVASGWWQTPWGSLPSDLSVAPATTDFSVAEIEAAHGFRTTLRWLSMLSLLLGVIVLALIAFTRGGSRWLETLLVRLPGGVLLRSATAVILILVILFLIRLPLSISSERIFRREGLSTNTWGSWGVDQAKGLVLSVVITTVAVVVIGALARWQPRFWWLAAATGAAAMTVALSFLFPVVVEPLFNRFTPMEEGRLRTALLQLAERDGVPVKEVLVADASRRTTALNAYVSGIGATRRIVVYDTLLSNAPEAEVQMVVAHELGHAKERDVLTGTLVGAVGAALAVLALALVAGSAVASPAGVAAILAWLAIFSFVQQPVSNLISRQIEARADQHALTLTADPQTFAQMQRRLAVTNRADVIAPRWAYLLFASHPSTRERIALSRWWAEGQGLPVPPPLAPR